MNTLVIYSAASLATNTVRDYVEAFARFFPSTVFFEPIEAEESLQFGLHLDQVDVVIIHYSANFQYSYFGITRLAKRLAGFSGVKVMFTQDDYDWTDKIRRGIALVKPDIVYSILPPETARQVYAEEIENGVEFRNCLTGYVPERFENRTLKPIADREIDVGYRGRTLPVWYGQLGFEKIQIGDRFKEFGESHDIQTDIESDTAKRIYGADWDHFLQNCRTMLASESGCNVFDFDGAIRDQVITAKRKNPEITDTELYERFVKEHEDVYPQTNQLSPKMFEAVAAGTVLVMYEGSYSDVFEPDRHYIALKKDFSNFDEVVAKIGDTDFLQGVADKAYEEIVAGGEYNYEAFCNMVLEEIRSGRELGNHSPVELMENVARRPLFRTVWERQLELIRRRLWSVEKSVQYIKEWGFATWFRKVCYFVRRKITLTFNSFLGRSG